MVLLFSGSDILTSVSFFSAQRSIPIVELFHFAGRPIVGGGFKLVVFAFIFVGNLNESAILCPIEL